MIESLIAYIQEHGYSVDVHPQTLILRKSAEDELCSLGWMISPLDLKFLPWEILTAMADEKMREIALAIEQKGKVV